MALDVYCSVPGCGLPMTMPGAVVVSPPMGHSKKRMQVTKFYKLLDDGEFENDAAHWPHLYRDFLDKPPTFTPKTVYKKQPLERDDIPRIDIVAVMAQAYMNRVQADMEQFVEPYCQADIELTTMWLDEEAAHAAFWEARRKKHPVWDLIKRGWL